MIEKYLLPPQQMARVGWLKGRWTRIVTFMDNDHTREHFGVAARNHVERHWDIVLEASALKALHSTLATD